MKKALIIGDYIKAQYHTLNGADTELASILEDNFDIDFCGDYGNLKLENIQNYALVINYTSKWTEKSKKTLVAAFLSYLAGGGSLLTLHQGIMCGNDYEMDLVHGAAFRQQQPLTLLDYRIADRQHAITSNIDDFTIEEEPYLFDFDPFINSTILLEYSYANTTYPAMWVKSYLGGKVAYMSVGHNADSFKNKSIRKIIRRTGLWACDRL